MHASNPETIYFAVSGDWTQARLITVSGSACTVPMSHIDKYAAYTTYSPPAGPAQTTSAKQFTRYQRQNVLSTLEIFCSVCYKNLNSTYLLTYCLRGYHSQMQHTLFTYFSHRHKHFYFSFYQHSYYAFEVMTVNLGLYKLLTYLLLSTHHWRCLCPVFELRGNPGVNRESRVTPGLVNPGVTRVSKTPKLTPRFTLGVMHQSRVN